ncbi:PEP-CTERM sorting domain-containing protein [[Empedobacter] haloabium]|uniref:PEP-CTERM sorting domain-containing protein n=1 Tax=[Empedobacter] haloabium TaxID=592317 RepID=A0ABZ1UHY1_9BURK
MNQKITTLLIAGLLFSGAASAASQASSASMRLSNLNLSVFDLTPDDGVTSAFTVKEMTTEIEASLYDGRQSWSDDQYPTGAASVNIAKYGSSSQTAWAGQFGGFDLNSSSATNSMTAGSWVSQRLTLTLAPQSGLVLDGWLSMTGHKATPSSNWLQSVYLNLTPQGSTGASEYRFEKRLVSTTFGPNDLDSNEQITMSYVNTSDVARDVSFQLYTQTSIRTVGLVPEPSTYAMLGAGLLALGLHARRRRTS